MACWILFLYALALTASTAVMSAALKRPSIEEAVVRLREFAQLLGDIKNSIQPQHCADILHAGQHRSGVYSVFHKAAASCGQSVYCDMETDGGGWTVKAAYQQGLYRHYLLDVIQRRGQFRNSVFHFYRNWTEYTNGFGGPAEEYWIGNRALHALTSGEEQMALRVVLSNSTDDSVSVDYESVRVGNEDTLFKIQVGKHLRPEGWDAMANANGQKFSTFDRDNDATSDHCAAMYHGGWWYSQCHAANLNGLNPNGPHESYADGIEWSVRSNVVSLYHYSYPAVHMMIRPAGLPVYRQSGLLTRPVS